MFGPEPHEEPTRTKTKMATMELYEKTHRTHGRRQKRRERNREWPKPNSAPNIKIKNNLTGEN